MHSAQLSLNVMPRANREEGRRQFLPTSKGTGVASTNEHFFVGCREDWWCRVEDGWKNEERCIVLDHGILENVTVFF